MAFSLGLTGLGSSLQKTLANSAPALTQDELQKRASLLNSVNEAFGVAVAESKTVDVVEEKFEAMFEKAKATQTYALSDFLKFRVVIPVKSLFGKASEAQKEDLELYNMHQELRSSIETVQKAYQNYISAEQAITQATPETLRTARFQEKNKATALITSYKDLIALAIKQAEDLSNKAGKPVTRSAYLQDAQTALDTGIEAQGAIFYTVHMLNTREAVGSVENDHAAKFITLVNNYNQLEGKALSEIGSRSESDQKAFKAAFIEGLATVSGLKASDVATYESCLMLAKDQYSDEMVNRFVAEMDLIIQGNKSAEEVLPGTRYNGVHFPVTDELIGRLNEACTRLQQLKGLEAKRDTLVRESEEARATIKSLKTMTKYTVQEFADFVGSTQDKLGLRSQIEAGKGQFAAVKALETLQKQIVALEEQSARNIAGFEKQIREKDQRFAQMNADFNKKAAEENACETEIRALTAALQALKKDAAEVSETLKRVNVASTSKQELLGQVIGAGQDVFAAREKGYRDLIAQQQQTLGTLRQDLEQRATAIRQLEGEISLDKASVAEFKNTGSPDVKDELQRLRAARETLSRTSSEISGDELLEIANSLGLINKREGNLGTAFANARKVRELEEAQAIRVKEFDQVEDLIDAAKQDLPRGIAYIEGTLKVISEEIFTDEQVAQMDEALDEQLQVAIEISRKAHDGILNTREILIDQANDKKYLGLTGLEQEALLTKRQEERALSRRDSFSSEASSQLSEDDSASASGLESPRSAAVSRLGTRALPTAATPASQPSWLSRNYGPARPAAADYFGGNALGMPIVTTPVAQQLSEAPEVINIDEA